MGVCSGRGSRKEGNPPFLAWTFARSRSDPAMSAETSARVIVTVVCLCAPLPHLPFLATTVQEESPHFPWLAIARGVGQNQH